jgi:hypothetical protein
MAKFALLQRLFLPKMYKSVGYLQNYPRTDKKKRREKKSNTPLNDFFLQINVELFFAIIRILQLTGLQLSGVYCINFVQNITDHNKFKINYTANKRYF